MTSHIGPGSPPVLSVGLPVYNGANFLERALDSLLAQTFRDFELIVSDNASTDATQAICERYAARDSRIRYIRQPANLGAGPNYNFVFEQSAGHYFKWIAHDDYLDAGALEACVRALEEDPGVVLAHPLLVDVDPAGNVLGTFDREGRGEELPPSRFAAAIDFHHNCGEVFGVYRRRVLARTRLIRDYTDSDRTLIGEIALQGKIRQVDAAREFRCRHAQQSAQAHREFWSRAAWFNPRNKGRFVWAVWPQLIEWLLAVLTAPVTLADRARCLRTLLNRMIDRRGEYIGELYWALHYARRRFRRRRQDATAGAIDTP